MKKMVYFFCLSLAASFILQSCQEQGSTMDDIYSYAQSRSADLKLSVYMVTWEIESLLSTAAGRREALSLIRANGITKIILETYRDGMHVDKAVLIELRDYFRSHGIEVIGGIAIRPGKNFGVLQDGPLGWLNWQNPKTREDVRKKVELSASIFDELMVDDFQCTSDTSMESKMAKGDRNWSVYRRDLLTEFSENIIVKAAKSVNPNITMTIKFPQWYDRFHLFGYDPVRQSALYDRVWIGTETRGQYTQRFGFVQPYEGFISYRWMEDIAGNKMGGAWFDHGDCDRDDFIEQAYQTVVAGAQEIILFSYGPFVRGHQGHHLLRNQFPQLADLAKSVAQNPVKGAAAYKPANSDAGGDLYIMDFIGSLGIPLIPYHEYPQDEDVVFLPTQAAADPDILSKIKLSLARKATLIFTAGFLAKVNEGEKVAALAGVDYPVQTDPLNANEILVSGIMKKLERGLDLETDIRVTRGKVLLRAQVGNRKVPFLIKTESENSTLYTLNSHTFSQEDFDRVGEVLLCPKPLGLLDVPEEWVNTIRNAFTHSLGFRVEAATRISVQPLGESGWLIHNYNKQEEDIALHALNLSDKKLTDGFSGKIFTSGNDMLKLSLKPRSRIWIRALTTN